MSWLKLKHVETQYPTSVVLPPSLVQRANVNTHIILNNLRVIQNCNTNKRLFKSQFMTLTSISVATTFHFVAFLYLTYLPI